MKILEHAGGVLELDRYPVRADERLQAWDAADEYLLRRWHEELAEACGPRPRVLLVNDSFGALGCALASRRPTSWSDSHLARCGLAHNLAANGLDPEAVRFLPADREPDGPYDCILLKQPRSLAAWADTLVRLRPALQPGTVVLSGGLIRHTPRRIYTLLESLIGPTETSPGWKKARLARSKPDLSDPAGRVAPADLRGGDYHLPEVDLHLSCAPGGFSRGVLDGGTRLLIPALPRSVRELDAADLGCGNGVLALVLARRCPRARILGVDESYRSVAAARANAVRAGLEGSGSDGRKPGVRFVVGDGLTEVAPASLDLVLCNPPYHQGRAEGDQVARGMFRQARRALRPRGRLLVVGNRHLGYAAALGRIFGACRTLVADRRFVVLEARGGAAA